MKKILKNKKGFTLIELLAVIVVLAIIMVIATQQVNGTIKKSRANSYFETVQNIRKGMQTACANDNKVDEDSLKGYVEYKDVEVSLKDGKFTVKPTNNGKFKNMETSVLPDSDDIYTISDTTITFNSEC